VRRLRYAVWSVGLAFGVAAEWIGKPELIGLDAAAGFALVFLGLWAWSRRPQTAVGPIMAAAGLAWFLGTFWSPALYLHRGLLTHLMLSYPSGRLWSRRERVAVAAAYVYAAVYPVAANDYATIAFALGLVAVAARNFFVASGPQRRARMSALAAATAFGVVLAEGAAVRLAGAGTGRAELAVYDVVVCLIAIGLFADLLWGRWSQATVTGLVVDLGDPSGAGTLRDRLARALGDPSLELAYWFPEQGRYLQESGRPIELPGADGQRVVTPIHEGGSRIAVLVHDASVLDDPGLVSAVASATRLAVSNASLQVDVRARVAKVGESRRRIVEASDEQRRRLEQELRDGAEQRLARVGDLISDLEPELERQLAATRVELRRLARGIHPATLTDVGLAGAVRELAERSAVPVVVVAPVQRYAPSVEAAAYFVCSEALANVAKYASASHVAIRVAADQERLQVEVADNGVGGARMSAGSGLRGLRDRVESLGGRFRVDSPPGNGTRLLAELPLS
jgi:signal transduction histidine kinase